MNMSQSFNTPGEGRPVFLGETLPDAGAAQPQVPTHSPTASQWRRVLDVILVEGQLRYLVERGE